MVHHLAWYQKEHDMYSLYRNLHQRRWHEVHTVSHIWSLICLPSMVIIRAPNSTPRHSGKKTSSLRPHTTRSIRALESCYVKFQSAIQFILHPWFTYCHINSYTPIVRSWTGWKRLSVNWSSRHDFPTPGTGKDDHEDQTMRQINDHIMAAKASAISHLLSQNYEVLLSMTLKGK